MKKSFTEWVGEIIDSECPDHGVSLDVGCGRQRYHDAFRNRVIGYDLRQQVGPTVAGTVEWLPFGDGSFDFATSFQCLYYSREVTVAATELTRVLKPGGTAIISVSGFWHLWWEQRRGELPIVVQGQRWWARLFEATGCQATALRPPARYRRWPGTVVRWLPSTLSPYRFLRLQTPGAERLPMEPARVG